MKENNIYQIIFYQDSRGKSEVEEYGVNLNKKKQKAVM